MTNFEKIVEAIELKLEEVGKDNIDYGAHIDDRFCYGILTYIESKRHSIWFVFDAIDCGNGFHIQDLQFEQNDALPNLINKLQNYKFIAYGK